MRGLEPGTEFAGHRIEEVAGRGGMGVVYKATHLVLDHVVALKVISPELVGDERFRKRFQSESRIAVSLRHPNVVSVHHAGEEDGQLFVTMDFIEGTDIRGLLNEEGFLGPARAASILSQVSAALDVAHARGLVHRDIKPGNVLIEPGADGDHAYLTDFGLTKAIDSQTGLTASGAFIGTLDYSSPEQIQGHRVDARGDVYALGCLLYEMLSGSVPFTNHVEKVAKMYAHLQEPPPNPREKRPELPAEFTIVVARAMAKDPEDRYPSAGDLARATEAAVEGRAVEAKERTVAVGLAAPADAAGATTAERSGEAVPTAQAGAPTAQPAEPTAQAPEPIAQPAEPTAPVAEPTAPPGTEERGAPPSEPATQRLPRSGEALTTPLPPRDVAIRRRRALLGIGVAAVIAAVIAVIVISGGGGGSDTAGEEGGGDQAADTGGGGGGEKDLGSAELVGGAIAVDGFPVGVAVTPDALWVGSRIGGTLTELDPQTKEERQTFDGLAAPEGVSAGPASVYVALAESAQVMRVNFDTGAASTFDVGTEPRAVAHGGPGVFVTNGGDDTVTPVEIEPDSETPLDPISVGDEPHGIAIGEGSVWVTNRVSGTVTQIDEDSLEVINEGIDVGANPKGIAVADGMVLVANTDDGTMTPIDAESGEPSEAFSVGGEPRGVVAAFDSIWVANGDGNVTRVDPVNAEVVQTMRIGTSGAATSPEELAAGEKFIYVTDGLGDAVYRIKP